MKVYIAWSADIEPVIQHATQHEKPEEIRRISNNVEHGNRQWEAWLLQNGGELVAYSGPQGTAIVPADRLAEIPDVQQRYRSAVGEPVSVGVGMKLYEAVQALQAAHARGGDRVVLWTPAVAQELADRADEDDILDEPVQKAQFNDSTRAPSLSTQIKTGEASPSAALPSAPSAASPASFSPAEPTGGAGPAPQLAAGGQPAPTATDQLKRSVVAVLQEAKKAGPALEQMKQSNPDAYQLINQTLQAMIQLARQLFGAQPIAVVKSESEADRKDITVEDVDPKELAAGIVSEMREHGFTEQQAKQVALDHLAEDPAYYSHQMEKAGIDPQHHARHTLHLPVGSQKDGRVKVVHSDGRAGWVSVRAGQILSEDNHPISSRNPEGR